VPADWVDRYKGKFDEGWDVYREQTLARQIKLGVVPPGTRMAPKPDDIVDWDTLSEDEQRLYARQMEVFAAFAEHTDHEVGRLVEAIEAMGEMDNTLFIYIFGDNGSSAEGGLNGTFNETIVLNGLPDPVEDQLQYMDEWGGPTSYPHFQAGWAVATNTPFQWTKQVASHYGGTRNPLVVHWPDGIDAKGEIRSHTITAEVEIPEGGGEGVILSQGGRFAGWSLYMKDGKVSYVHNWVGKERYTITAPDPVAAGKATMRLPER